MATTITLDQLAIITFRLSREALAANVTVIADYQISGSGVTVPKSKAMTPTPAQQTALNAMWLAAQNVIVAQEGPDPAKITPS